MFFKLKNQEQIVRRAIEKAGSFRGLSKIIKIPRSTILNYTKGQVINQENFDKITNFLRIKDKEKIISKKLENNWKQIIGGKNCVKTKKHKGTFDSTLRKAQEKGALKISEWHKDMKKNHPKEYYLSQYSKFKKIGGYKFVTKRGEKVRNILEKQIADILFSLKINYQYEPLVNIGNRYFFPDFLINNKVIIECTMWKGESKAYQLREKINYFNKAYDVYVVIPKHLNRYYFILKDNLIVGLNEFVPVAQTFTVPKE